MKTKKQFFKENILSLLSFSIPLGFTVGIPLSYVLVNDLYYWITLFLIILYFNISLINNWYNDYRFKELAKEIEQLKSN